MLSTLVKHQLDFGSLVLRLGLAAIFTVHGYLKVMQDYPMIPDTSLGLQIAVGWIELLCGLAMLVGLVSRLAAIGLIVVQVGAIVRITGNYALEIGDAGFKGTDFLRVGPEYNLALICMALAILFIGSGCISVDHMLCGLWRRKQSNVKTSGTAARV